MLECFRPGKCIYKSVDITTKSGRYGLGSVYKNEKKHAMAEIHYRKALDLQPNDPIFLQYLGMVCHNFTLPHLAKLLSRL